MLTSGVVELWLRVVFPLMLLCMFPILFIYLYYFGSDTERHNGVCVCVYVTGPFSGVVNSSEAASHLDILVGNKKLT